MPRQVMQLAMLQGVEAAARAHVRNLLPSHVNEPNNKTKLLAGYRSHISH